METKNNKTGAIRPSPLASVVGIVGLGAFILFGIFFIPAPDETSIAFKTFLILICIVGIGYNLINLLTFSDEQKRNIPLTAGDVVEIVEDKKENKNDFEVRLRKLESLRRDKLISEKEYKIKRKEILEEKW